MIVLTGQRLGGLLWEGSSIRDEDNGERRLVWRCDDGMSYEEKTEEAMLHIWR
jgi:hypothetical protein